MKPVLYTINCPQCKVLEGALKKANIEFEVCKDMNEMRSLGIMSVPVLDVDGQLMRFKDAFNWVKQQKGGE